jgi:hypothetical protein
MDSDEDDGFTNQRGEALDIGDQDFDDSEQDMR